jgi:phosphoglucomutase
MARLHELAGKRPLASQLLTRSMVGELYNKRYSLSQLSKIKNGTSGFRGETGPQFCAQHVKAITQALCDIRQKKGYFGPDELPEFLKAPLSGKARGPIIAGKDPRFSSDSAIQDAAEVFAGNLMPVYIEKGGRATPTPVISHEILRRNLLGENVEGVIFTASHNPPLDGGYKTNGRDGGPNTLTKPIDEKSNPYLADDQFIVSDVFMSAFGKKIIEKDFMTPYIEDLHNVVDMESLKGKRFGVTPLGGAACGYYEAINAMYGTKIEILLPDPDPAASHCTYDWDGKLRRDPSSVYVMLAIVGMREKLGVPFVGANDPDADRYGGIDSKGVLDPNKVFCVVADYIFNNRNFDKSMGIGRTIGTTHMLDLIAANYGRPVDEQNVGWKNYVKGILAGKYAIMGEESASFSIPRMNGSVWVTEKDGILANLILMEIIARTGMDIGTYYAKILASKYGAHQYERVDMTATDAKKERLAVLAKDPDEVARLLHNKTIAGRNIERLKVGDGVKVVLEGGVWVLKRASGTEPIIKDYREEKGANLETAQRASRELDALLKLDM